MATPYDELLVDRNPALETIVVGQEVWERITSRLTKLEADNAALAGQLDAGRRLLHDMETALTVPDYRRPGYEGRR